MTERDLAGYAGKPPHPRWPGDARLALQFVLNVEEGAESCVLNGDAQSEAYLHELPGRPARIGERDLSVEGLYEYGSRAGIWRILDLFAETELTLGDRLPARPAASPPRLRLFDDVRHLLSLCPHIAPSLRNLPFGPWPSGPSPRRFFRSSSYIW